MNVCYKEVYKKQYASEMELAGCKAMCLTPYNWHWLKVHIKEALFVCIKQNSIACRIASWRTVPKLRISSVLPRWHKQCQELQVRQKLWICTTSKLQYILRCKDKACQHPCTTEHFRGMAYGVFWNLNQTETAVTYITSRDLVQVKP